MYAVIRIRGTAKIRKEVKDTLKFLRLNKPNHCVLVEENGVYKGMVKKVKDYITWGEVDDKTKKLLIEKRGRKKKEVKVYRLNPPKKGFEIKGVRKAFKQGGALGYRGKKINDLLERMV